MRKEAGQDGKKWGLLGLSIQPCQGVDRGELRAKIAADRPKIGTLTGLLHNSGP